MGGRVVLQLLQMQWFVREFFKCNSKAYMTYTFIFFKKNEYFQKIRTPKVAGGRRRMSGLGYTHTGPEIASDKLENKLQDEPFKLQRQNFYY